MQARANFAGVLGAITKKAAASLAAQSPDEDVCSQLKAAITKIDAFGAEGSQAVSAEEVCLWSQYKQWWSVFSYSITACARYASAKRMQICDDCGCRPGR